MNKNLSYEIHNFHYIYYSSVQKNNMQPNFLLKIKLKKPVLTVAFGVSVISYSCTNNVEQINKMEAESIAKVDQGPLQDSLLELGKLLQQEEIKIESLKSPLTNKHLSELENIKEKLLLPESKPNLIVYTGPYYEKLSMYRRKNALEDYTNEMKYHATSIISPGYYTQTESLAETNKENYEKKLRIISLISLVTTNTKGEETETVINNYKKSKNVEQFLIEAYNWYKHNKNSINNKDHFCLGIYSFVVNGIPFSEKDNPLFNIEQFESFNEGSHMGRLLDKANNTSILDSLLKSGAQLGFNVSPPATSGTLKDAIKSSLFSKN